MRSAAGKNNSNNTDSVAQFTIKDTQDVQKAEVRFFFSEILTKGLPKLQNPGQSKYLPHAHYEAFGNTCNACKTLMSEILAFS